MLDWQARASDRGRYRHWLARLYGFHRGWEPAVAHALAEPSFFEPRRKLDLLAADLRALGMSDRAMTDLPTPPSPRFDGTAEALGSLYVLEGSTLGGKLIARHVAATLGFVPAYHDAYGRRAGPMWRTFQARLDREEAGDAAVASARETFAGLAAWLTAHD